MFLVLMQVVIPGVYSVQPTLIEIDRRRDYHSMSITVHIHLALYGGYSAKMLIFVSIKMVMI